MSLELFYLSSNFGYMNSGKFFGDINVFTVNHLENIHQRIRKVCVLLVNI